MITDILVYVSSLSVFSPLIITIIRGKYLTKELKILLAYVIASILLEVLGITWAYVLHKSNHFILNTFSIIEFVLISLIFREVSSSLLFKKIALLIITAFSILAITLFSDPNVFATFNSTVHTLSCLLITIWVFIYYYQLLQTLQVNTLSTSPMFWISVGCLLYFSGTLFVFLYGEIILKKENRALYDQLWIIYYTLLFIFRILLAVGLWFSKTHLQSSLLSRQEQQ